MKVLVTGGGGFLGQALVRRLLSRGDTVRTLGRGDYPELAAQGAKVYRGDVADAGVVSAAARGCEAIVHTAAKVGSWGRARDFHRTNVLGTEQVIAACRREGVARLVYTSSPSVVGHGEGDLEGIDESHPVSRSFDADYPRTKAVAEALVLSANDPSLSTVALRPHLIWGPGDGQLFPRLIARARAGRLVLPSGPPRLVDCTYIDNAVDAHVQALDRLGPGAACAGRAYFISQGEPVSVNELVDRVLGAAGLAPVERRISPRLLYALGVLCEASYTVLGIRDHEPPITRFVARQLSTAHWYDLSAARRDLGYAPRVSLDEGLRRLAESLARAA